MASILSSESIAMKDVDEMQSNALNIPRFLSSPKQQSNRSSFCWAKRKKAAKILVSIAMLHVLYIKNPDENDIMVRRRIDESDGEEVESMYGMVFTKKKKPVEDIPIIAEVFTESLTNAKDVPLVEGVDADEAYELGVWREMDGTNTDKEDAPPPVEDKKEDASEVEAAFEIVDDARKLGKEGDDIAHLVTYSPSASPTEPKPLAQARSILDIDKRNMHVDLPQILQQFSGQDLDVALASLQQQYSEQDLAAALGQAQMNDVLYDAKILEGGEDSLDTHSRCKDDPSIPAPKLAKLKPTMFASYPGSGALLSWELIRAITGFMTSDDVTDLDDLSKNGLVVAIQTHYPTYNSELDEFFDKFADIDRSILLIRNPIHAMPSYVSYLFEREHGLDMQSARVPLEQWIEWRDENFQEELLNWSQHIIFWMRHNTNMDNLVISYERLTDEKVGPMEYARMGWFLQETTGKELAQPLANIPCVWDFIVNSRAQEKKSKKGDSPGSVRRGPMKDYPLTDFQYDTAINYFDSLAKKYPDALGVIMDGYVIDTIKTKEKLHRQVLELGARLVSSSNPFQ